MSKQITVSFYDACLPDYFGGHHKPVLQYPVDGNTTRKELYNGLLFELSQGVIDYQIDELQLDYDAIRQAIKDCIYFKPEWHDNDILFPDLPAYKDLESDDSIVYAFFIVNWGED
jgi:hypothetical protein